MYFRHSAKIWQQFPHLVPGLLVIETLRPDVDVDVNIAATIQPWHNQARQRLSQGPESQLAEISAWRQAYTQMGLKPTQYRSAAEALLRRFRREDNLPTLHPLVDLCNAVSLAFALPVAVFDLDQVDRYLEVRHAIGTETYLAFNNQTEAPSPEEIIFADASNQVHARRWTFRQSRKSVISSETKRALIVSEGLHETAPDDIRRLIDVLGEAIERVWGPPKETMIFTAALPRLDF